MKTYIYTLSHPLTKEIRYVGKTIDVKRRYYDYISPNSGDVIKNNHKGAWLRSLKKSGLNPVIDVIDEIEDVNWDWLEIYWISQFKAWGFDLLNVHSGGSKGGRPKGYKVSEETRQRMKNAYRAPFTKEHLNNMSLCQKGLKKHTEESKRRIGEKNRILKIGTKLSSETKIKIGASPKYKIPVSLYDLSGKKVAEFSSQTDAAKYYNICLGTINNNLKGFSKTTKVGIWKKNNQL